MTMIERVARNLATRADNMFLTGYTWEMLAPVSQKYYMDIVRAAIEAMREPSEEMVAAGEREFFEYKAEPSDWTLKGTREAWQTMIDAALAEGQK